MHSREPVFQYSEFVYLSEFLKQRFQVLFLQVSGDLADEKLDGVVVLHWDSVLADGEPVHPAGAVRGAESILLLHSVCSDCSHLSSMGRRGCSLSLSLSLSRSLSHSLSLSLYLSLSLSLTLPLSLLLITAQRTLHPLPYMSPLLFSTPPPPLPPYYSSFLSCFWRSTLFIYFLISFVFSFLSFFLSAPPPHTLHSACHFTPWRQVVLSVSRPRPHIPYLHNERVRVGRLRAPQGRVRKQTFV